MSTPPTSSAAPVAAGTRPSGAAGSRRPTGLYLAALALALVLAGAASTVASDAPDGLERVAEDHGFAGTARDSAAARSPLGDYGASGVDDDRASVGVAGVAGVVVTLVAGAAVLRLVVARRRSPT